MKALPLLEAARQVEQAQSVLSMWLELCKDTEEANKIAVIITLLDGVPEAMDAAELLIYVLENPDHSEAQQ
ncbi:hypothetical protein AI29_07900 [bacteria symbiont BFo2 of Frankliniella occidentalis]|nr:hypothetical protein AI29_07900 [bacteria symbiont BFo2 of Frankliniella occidentalis]KYP92543.1 hypothetical protein WB60_05085 [bacteria symbiont BFo2 of Frankliniella occidentalis]KYP94205.1 hypothetical protein WB67_10615 [bacteria symbiont BFo2 of Frankliniella occidentalis]